MDLCTQGLVSEVRILPYCERMEAYVREERHSKKHEKRMLKNILFLYIYFYTAPKPSRHSTYKARYTSPILSDKHKETKKPLKRFKCLGGSHLKNASILQSTEAFCIEKDNFLFLLACPPTPSRTSSENEEVPQAKPSLHLSSHQAALFFSQVHIYSCSAFCFVRI